MGRSQFPFSESTRGGTALDESIPRGLGDQSGRVKLSETEIKRGRPGRESLIFSTQFFAESEKRNEPHAEEPIMPVKKKAASKRELIEPRKGDKRFVRRKA